MFLSNSMEKTISVELKKLPLYTDLKKEISKVVAESSLWERHGIEWLYMGVALSSMPWGFYMLKAFNYPDSYSNSWLSFVCGIVLLGWCHAMLTMKACHMAVHGSLAQTKKWNDFWLKIILEFIGSYSVHMSTDIHIRMHHPHTNIIGLGDSSTWRIPWLSCYVYMFLAPLTLPIITPFVAVSQLWGQWRELASFLPLASLGWICHFLVLTEYCGFSFMGALLCLSVYRAVFAIPYIHVNIFQHIGLAMYSPDSRPTRIYQMATSVLNLHRNPLLDWTFGHSIISCHVEHHLFPGLSDNMCLKIKPLVSVFLRKHGLPYHYDTYFGRLRVFLDNYTDYMVKAPPIIHFVGIQ